MKEGSRPSNTARALKPAAASLWALPIGLAISVIWALALSTRLF